MGLHFHEAQHRLKGPGIQLDLVFLGNQMKLGSKKLNPEMMTSWTMAMGVSVVLILNEKQGITM